MQHAQRRLQGRGVELGLPAGAAEAALGEGAVVVTEIQFGPALALEQAGPSRLRPILMTSLVLVLAMLPVALKLGDGGDLRAPLGAVLWFGSEALGAVLTRLQSRTGNLAAAGVVAFGMLFRAIAVMVVVFAVAVSDKWLGLAAALTYAAGYSANLGLQLVAYYTGPKAGAAH